MLHRSSVLMRLLAVAGLAVLFGAIMVAAGHGAGPIGYLLVLGRAVEWLPGQVLGWTGLLLCIASVFREAYSSYLVTLLWGLALLVLSVLAFAVASDAAGWTLLFSLPLLGASVFVLAKYRGQRHAS